MSSGVRQRRGEATRNGILEVARRLFSEFGYHNTGISDIQAATGLTKGAFYHHFRAKQELALGVLKMVRRDYVERMFGPAMDGATPGRQLGRVLDAAVELNEGPEWRNCRLLATFSAELTPADGPLVFAVRQIQQELLDTLCGMIRRAQETNESPEDVPEVQAQLVLAALLGTVLAKKSGLPGMDAESVFASLRKSLLIDGARSEPPASSR